MGISYVAECVSQELFEYFLALKWPFFAQNGLKMVFKNIYLVDRYYFILWNYPLGVPRSMELSLGEESLSQKPF